MLLDVHGSSQWLVDLALLLHSPVGELNYYGQVSTHSRPAASRGVPLIVHATYATLTFVVVPALEL